ncbi:protein translocase subunit SecF [bacterium]|nr:MAG: protein translocase subunit SecF [bacterium]
MLELIKNPKIDFLKSSKLTFSISGAIILIGIISIIAHGGLNWGIDFTGGTLVEIRFEKALDIGKVRSALAELGLAESDVQTIGTSSREFLIRTKITGEKGETSIDKKILALFKEKLPDNPSEIMRIEAVGPKVGSELRWRALWATILAFLGILLYVSFRFQFRFGVAAVLALFHDVFITITVLSLINAEFSLTTIAALLTIIGYSINDSIVISDRIRENIRVMYREAFSKIVNISLNQTLSRTIITSLSTLLALVSIFLLGGRVLRLFSIPLIIGVIVGTYSSVFIVSPVVASWEEKFPSRFKKK